jgi:hypothetical protein
MRALKKKGGGDSRDIGIVVPGDTHSATARGPVHVAGGGGVVGAVYRRAGEPDHPPAFCAGQQPVCYGKTFGGGDTRDHQAVRVVTVQVQGDLGIVAYYRGKTRRAGTAVVRGIGGPAGCRAQDRLGGDVAGVRGGGVSGGYAHTPLSGTLGPKRRKKRGKNRARPEGRFSGGNLEQVALANHLFWARVLPGARAQGGALPDLFEVGFVALLPQVETLSLRYFGTQIGCAFWPRPLSSTVSLSRSVFSDISPVGAVVGGCGRRGYDR